MIGMSITEDHDYRHYRKFIYRHIRENIIPHTAENRRTVRHHGEKPPTDARAEAESEFVADDDFISGE